MMHFRTLGILGPASWIVAGGLPYSLRLLAQEEKVTSTLGQIKLVFAEANEGAAPRLTIHVLRAMDPISEAALQTDFEGSGLVENLHEIVDRRYPEAKVEDVVKVEKENVVLLSLKPGTYHVLIRQGVASGIWLTDLKVVAGETLERPVTLSKLGSLRGTWTIDQPAAGKDPASLAHTRAILYRDGRVWAATETKKVHTFLVDEVPPGSYTLVVRDYGEGFTSLSDNVVISSEKETAVKLSIRAEKLVYFIGRFKNKKTQADIPWDAWREHRIALLDAKRGIPLGGNYFSTGQSGQKEGWLRLPADVPFNLSVVLPKFKPLEKLPVKLSRYTEKPGLGWDDRAEVQSVFLVPLN